MQSETVEERVVVLVSKTEKREMRIDAASEGKSMSAYLRDLHKKAHEARERDAA